MYKFEVEKILIEHRSKRPKYFAGLSLDSPTIVEMEDMIDIALEIDTKRIVIFGEISKEFKESYEGFKVDYHPEVVTVDFIKKEVISREKS